MRLWIVIHHHKHGQDVFPCYQEAEPTPEQQEEAVGECGFGLGGRGEEGESLEVRGPFDLPIDQPLRFALLAGNGCPIKETVLCSACALSDDGASLYHARKHADQADDVDPEGPFTPCDPALPCCICEDREPEPEGECCDWGHTAPEIRKLPAGGGNVLLLCRNHYDHEAVARREAGHSTPAWDDLERYDPS